MATTRSTLTPALTPEEIADLVVTAVVEASVAADIATVHISNAKEMTFPLITEDLSSAWIAESAPVSLSDIGTGEVTIRPSKVIAASRVSNESLEDSDPALARILGDSIARSIAAKTDAAVFGSAAAPAPAGLGSLTGFSAAGTTDLASGVDAFHDAIAAVRSVGATPTAILVSPASALRLAKMKEATGARKGLLTPDPTEPTTLQVAGIPLVVSRGVSDSAIFVVDRARLALVVRKSATIEVDRSAFALTRESLVIGEARVGFAVLQASSVAKITVSAPTP